MGNLRDYAVVTGTYWVFTLTDGALRMLVLLHLHQTGRSPFEIASLFLFYELFGVITNLFGGWLGARHGLKLTLFAGLTLQIIACSLLAVSAAQLTLALLLLAQALSGTAKDLTKMSSKSYVKLVAPKDDGPALLRWVAVLTGSKNTLKGAGFFLGGLLLTTIGFEGACASMAAALAAALLAAGLLLPRAAGRPPQKTQHTRLLSRSPKINWLSAARFFLFGSRDIWFVLALPIFLSSTLGWAHPQVGGFLALWVIGYGIIQALAPAYINRQPSRQSEVGAEHLALWTSSLLIPLGAIAAGLFFGAPPLPTLIAGLTLFAILFATNSALHSYLIVAYSTHDNVSLNVGFYYMANAAGRLTGTVLSGALFQAAGQGTNGMLICIAGSTAFVIAAALLSLPLRDLKA